MQAGDIFSLIGMLVGFILLLALAYWAAKLVGRGYGGGPGGAGRMVEVLGRVGLGQEKQLLVVKTGGRVLLLGVTAHHIELLEELDPARLPEPPAAGRSGDFLSALKGALESRKGKESGDEGNADTRDT